MTALDLMYKMAERAKVLANEKLPTLRYANGTADTYHGAQAENKHMNRGELVESILIDEFEDVATKLAGNFDSLEVG